MSGGGAARAAMARAVRTGTVIQTEQIPADTSSHQVHGVPRKPLGRAGNTARPGNDVWRYGARSVLPLGGADAPVTIH
ncbi:hypothetical protein GCM10010206_35000 [Streptomyces cinerochromogenes]|nr:hypothetical protein GCM10010206_35000 [Streptomyces cinerochromogenes]